MATFDKVIVPTGITPADTLDTPLYQGLADSAIVVSATNVGELDIVTIRVGINPTGAVPLFWLVYGLSVIAGESYSSQPMFIRAGDAIVVGTNDANEVTFSVNGVMTT